jgi:hypothetical protein
VLRESKKLMQINFNTEVQKLKSEYEQVKTRMMEEVQEAKITP